jgi:hypothetical protein
MCGEHVTPDLPLKQVIKSSNTNISDKFFTNYTSAALEKTI